MQNFRLIFEKVHRIYFGGVVFVSEQSQLGKYFSVVFLFDVRSKQFQH